MGLDAVYDVQTPDLRAVLAGWVADHHIDGGTVPATSSPSGLGGAASIQVPEHTDSVAAWEAYGEAFAAQFEGIHFYEVTHWYFRHSAPTAVVRVKSVYCMEYVKL